ncbi:MAG: hypothetical protein IKK46_00130 [Clostridia bacterium]|nr:hypothetical protein [Clostridia bacterium]
MKITFDKKKSSEAISSLVNNTVDLSKKTATKVKSNAESIVEKAKNDSVERKLKKLNPIFPEQYKSESFHIPNMIIIVDDAVRRDEKLCEGAIGWLGKEKDIEILYLYDEAIDFSGINFIPSPNCDSIYYVDTFDRNKFIRIDCIFQKAHEERLAELEHIAYSLGAKRCTIEITEKSADTNYNHIKVGASEAYDGVKVSENAEQSLKTTDTNNRSGISIIEFSGSNTPKKPTLKWFAHDNGINGLIEMRCSGDNSVKTRTLKLSGSSSATMSQKAAYAIDIAVGKTANIGGQTSMDSQAAKEHHSELIFNIEF